MEERIIRLDIKIESTRDALRSVDKSVTTLSANVDRIDGKVEALESRMDRFENAITTRIDEKTSALAARLDQTDKKIDETKAILIERIDNRAALLDERIDSVFERNFLRGTAALIGAVPVMFGAFRFLQRTSLDADQIIGVTVLAGVLIWAVAFFATRRKSQRKVSAG